MLLLLLQQYAAVWGNRAISIQGSQRKKPTSARLPLVGFVFCGCHCKSFRI